MFDNYSSQINLSIYDICFCLISSNFFLNSFYYDFNMNCYFKLPIFAHNICTYMNNTFKADTNISLGQIHLGISKHIHIKHIRSTHTNTRSRSCNRNRNSTLVNTCMIVVLWKLNVLALVLWWKKFTRGIKFGTLILPFNRPTRIHILSVAVRHHPYL